MKRTVALKRKLHQLIQRLGKTHPGDIKSRMRTEQLITKTLDCGCGHVFLNDSLIRMLQSANPSRELLEKISPEQLSENFNSREAA